MDNSNYDLTRREPTEEATLNSYTILYYLFICIVTYLHGYLLPEKII